MAMVPRRATQRHLTDTRTEQADAPQFLDWSRANIGEPAPCVLCRRPALLRDPETGRPKHKVCAEAQLARTELRQ